MLHKRRVKNQNLPSTSESNTINDLEVAQACSVIFIVMLPETADDLRLHSGAYGAIACYHQG